MRNKLTERDLSRIVKRIINEQPEELPSCSKFKIVIKNNFGWFYPGWDDSDNMILIADKDYVFEPHPDYPMKKNVKFCKCA